MSASGRYLTHEELNDSTERPFYSEQYSTCILIHIHWEFPVFPITFGVDIVSMLTHTCPHNPLRMMKMANCNHQVEGPLYMWPDQCWSGYIWYWMSLLKPGIVKAKIFALEEWYSCRGLALVANSGVSIIKPNSNSPLTNILAHLHWEFHFFPYGHYFSNNSILDKPQYAIKLQYA